MEAKVVCLFRRRDISSSLNSLADSNARECLHSLPISLPQDLRTRHVPAGVSPGSMPKGGCEFGGGWEVPGLRREACCYTLGLEAGRADHDKESQNEAYVCEWRDI